MKTIIDIIFLLIIGSTIYLGCIYIAAVLAYKKLLNAILQELVMIIIIMALIIGCIEADIFLKSLL